LRMLEELAEIGMTLARAVQQQVLDQAAAEPAEAAEQPGAGNLALVFSRISRAVRQTIALEAKLAEEGRTRDEQTAAEQARRAVVDGRERKQRRRAQAKRFIEQAVDIEAADHDAAEELLWELDERLDDVEADFADRPIGEIVARICRDMGLAPEWSLWAKEEWAVEEIATRPPGSPFTGLRSVMAAEREPPPPPPPSAAATGSDPP
jgi:hypothetical protein